jgi:hypothetical protein
MRPSTANLTPQYASENGCPTVPPMLVTLTMRPEAAARIEGSTNWVSAGTPM